MSGTEPKVSIETITPERAKADLERTGNRNYRKRKPDHIKELARQMKEGKWTLNGEAIKYDSQGRVIDGQHRLLACIMAGVEFRTLVVRGVEDDLDLDTGVKRNMADYLAYHGEKNCTVLGATLNLQWLMDKGCIASRRHAGDQKPTKKELMETLHRHPGLKEAVANAMRYDNASASLMAFVLYNASQASPVLAEKFLTDLIDQINLSENDPARLLNLRLEKIKEESKKKIRTDKTVVLAILIKGWNAYATGRPVTGSYFRIRLTGSSPEEYPTFVTKGEIDSGESAQAA